MLEKNKKSIKWDEASLAFANDILAIKSSFQLSDDFVCREFTNALGSRCALFFIDGMVEQATISNAIMEPLMIEGRKLSGDVANAKDMLDKLLTACEATIEESVEPAIKKVLSGDTMLIFEGESLVVTVNTKGWERRSVSEPQTESVVRGPRHGFTETLRTNTAMLRRIIQNTNLAFESAVIGEQTNTMVSIAYIKGIANESLVSSVKERLSRIDTDEILSSGYIEAFIEEEKTSPFPTIAYSEKPDVVASKILEGRIAVIIDGSPFVLTVPMLFIEHFISPEDYTNRTAAATFLRLIRCACFFVSLLTPAVYIALINFHYEIIPTSLLFRIAAASEGLPFPAVFEVCLMLLIFEILQEAGLRLPKPVGQTISFVGALIMGQSAVDAGIVSPLVMIVVSLSAVSGYVIPTLASTLSVVRWALLLMAAMFGSIGITIALFCIYLHLSSLTSFGVPIGSPFSPFEKSDIKDTVGRVPLWRMNARPKSIMPQDLVRQYMPKEGSGK
ncbi:MAG: spore germination protein [Eubacteriaceae bacterium]|nr:spore germination protein [Eubacteriaceae bacterium]